MAHRFLIINEQEDVGYYLLSGSYLEGLSLLCQSKENGHFRGKKELFNNLFSQQQIFLENLIEVGNYTTDLTDNSQQLLDLLISIRNVFTSCKAKIVNGKLQLDTIPKKEDLMKIQENIADYKAIVNINLAANLYYEVFAIFRTSFSNFIKLFSKLNISF